MGVSLPWHGPPTATVPWSCCCPSTGCPQLQSVRGVPAPVWSSMAMVPQGPSCGMEHLLPGAVSYPVKLPLSLLNLPEVLGADGLFMLVPQPGGTACDWLRAASCTGHHCSPLLLKPCCWCPISRCGAGFSDLVFKFYSAKKQCAVSLGSAVLNFVRVWRKRLTSGKGCLMNSR